MEVLGPDNAFWVDGEWIGWDSIVDPEEERYSRLAELEREAELRFRYPNADPTLIPYFEDLLALAESYYTDTGQHLQVYGDIGELFGAVMYGIRLHRNYAQGSDGRLGNDFVEIKTISPMKKEPAVNVRLDRNFNKLLIVKIDCEFQVSGKHIDRKRLKKTNGNVQRLSASTLQEFGL